MKDQVSLQSIINMVLKEKGIIDNNSKEANERALRRTFERFVTNLGGDIELLKNENGRFVIYNDDIPFMKMLLSCLYDHNELFECFLDNTKDAGLPSIEATNAFIGELLKQAEQDEYKRNELYQLAELCCKMFLLGPRRAIAKCHAHIDLFWSYIQGLTYKQQSDYLERIATFLEAEIMRLMAESTISIKKTCDSIKSLNLSPSCTPYEHLPDDIKSVYLQRDRNILAAIQNDSDLRWYIEKTCNMEAEKIFGYTAFKK